MVSENTVEYQRELAKLRAIDEKAQHEQRVLEQALDERLSVLSRIVGDAWLHRTLPDKVHVELDPLLAKKFKTRAGYSTIRLENLLLEVDKVDTLGSEDLRAKRKQRVTHIQKLLEQADELNKKAMRLVQFQDHLIEHGKGVLRKTLGKSPEPEPSAEQSQGKVRRFASSEHDVLVPIPEAPSTGKEGSVGEAIKTGDDGAKDRGEDTSSTDIDRAESTSLDEMKAAQEAQSDHERQIRNHYERPNDKLSPTDKEEAEDEEGSRPKHVEKRQNRELEEPKVTIKEHPRAYVMVVQDPNVDRAKVSLDTDNTLNIVIRGKAPLRFTLGQNINVRAITKETEGDVMQLVLPKVQSVNTMRTGRPHGYVQQRGFAPMRPAWGLNDFWSRF